MDGYLLFSDGSLYHYDAESMSVVVALTDALIHGRTFNFQYRRALNLFGGYERVLSVPGTAQLIYHYPPYPGVDPGPCVSALNWNDLLWDSPPDVDTPTGTGSNDFSNVGAEFSLNSNCPNSDGSNATFLNYGGLVASLTAPVSCTLALTLLGYAPGWIGNPASGLVQVYDSAPTYFLSVVINGSTPLGLNVYPFTVPATAVMPLNVIYATTACYSLGAPAQVYFLGELSPQM